MKAAVVYWLACLSCKRETCGSSPGGSRRIQAISALLQKYHGIDQVFDIIKNCESSETSGDFSFWVEKLQNIKDKLKVLPLFLSGSAFAIYQQLLEEAKADYNHLKEELTGAFSCDTFVTYEQPCDQVLQEGETVGAYLADLRQLVSLMGQQEPDQVLHCAFIS